MSKMEKGKDGVTLIADAIRREMAQEKENAKTTETPKANVIDVTAQFSTPPAKATETKTTEAPPPAKTETDGNNDGTIYENE